ncbi:Hypothetical protein, putative [Bodo saltans]|uniref:WW domain-containing protein n=1 Tax=Bodo saltans TaxID=75058 RepID=A0A0S4IPB1_BODSA|nr:Hypothetical protein, putative [Bodo saltans]|eukprot:CUE70466.1 Hypothetical protein, putative [Bodo saltans]
MKRSRSRSPSFSSKSSQSRRSRSSSQTSSSSSSSRSSSSSSSTNTSHSSSDRSSYHRRSSRRYRSSSRRRDNESERRYSRTDDRRTSSSIAPVAATKYEVPDEVASPSSITRPDVCCVRIGVFRPPVPVTKAQVIDEIDAIRMTSRVEEVFIEPRTLAEMKNPDAPTYARIYFASPEWADLCAVELNTPHRTSKWRHMISQRLPLLGPMCGDIKSIPAFAPFRAEPADSILIETTEGYVVFSTNEIYLTRGAIDYLDAKRHGRILQRGVCQEFDPQRYTPCANGTDCSDIHVKAVAIWKLLLPTTAKQPIRTASSSVKVSVWEYNRRRDTLVLRYLAADDDVNSIAFMFGGCDGFLGASIQCTREGKRFGFVQFKDQPSAFAAMAQTAGSNLNVSFYGAMEDIRTTELSTAADPQSPMAAKGHEKERPVLRSGGNKHPDTHFRGTSAAMAAPLSLIEGDHNVLPQVRNLSPEQHPANAPPPPSSENLPFPPLPEGWEHGVSRRTRQYFFFQPKTKNSTTWKHPDTKERYSY